MTPKYRGDDNDYLDSDKERGAHGTGRVAKKKRPAASYLPIAEANGTVVEVFPNQCKVIDAGGQEFACTYRKAKLPTLELRERAPVAVGDRVRFAPVGNRDGVIEGICERKNFLSRPAPEKAMRHTIVANIDLLVIAAAAREPEFTPGLVDRFLIAAQIAEIEPVICITKMDLVASDDERPWNLYRDIGFKVVETCAKSGLGFNEIRAAMENKLSTFCGHSGVGKTTILNALLGIQVGKTREVSSSTGKGMHTTTSAFLIPGTQLIDTPGVRAFGLLDVKPEEIRNYFPELQNLKCEDEDCWHLDEEGCTAQELPRYQSYRRIVESVAAGEH
jgi:ribosome biogenesis GTPase / thiamine phosphate phosphatase